MSDDTPAQQPANAANPADQPKKKEGESWIETVKTVFYALLIALVIRTLLFQPFNIPSASMQATLLVGDYVFVEKYAYGYSKASVPYMLAPFSGRIFGSSPERGDVVVFKMPNVNSPEYHWDYIKRCIGLPGDRVQMINGVLYLNDKPIPKVRVADSVETDAYGITTKVAQYRETLPGGRSYLVLDRGDSEEDNTQAFVVPPGYYFMMGDNRDNSDDSRMSVGYVPAEDLVGRAKLRFFSVDDSFIWYEPWTWPGGIRYSRMFTFVE
jgi:signal peptidase I